MVVVSLGWLSRGGGVGVSGGCGLVSFDSEGGGLSNRDEWACGCWSQHGLSGSGLFYQVPITVV